jgi:phage gpG-like protein
MSYTYKDNTDEVLSALGKAKKRGLEAIGLVAEGHAKKITPVDTGRLRNSIAHAVYEDAAYIGTSTSYAPFVELGARGRKGVHMLQRSATEHADEYKRLMEDSIQNA